eukprot:596850-Pelagomonas_calceolata.AAC.3
MTSSSGLHLSVVQTCFTGGAETPARLMRRCVNAKGLLCERILTTGVLAWAYNGLGTWCPVIRYATRTKEPGMCKGC